MATVSIDLQDLNSLLGLGLQRRRALFQDLYNTGRAKAGQPAVNDVGSVILTPTSPSATLPLENQVVARVKTAIAAAS
ncbi:hypothetical protein OG407_20940 [Streptomyces sp. NBC_01515]|uniref:hypothetical protein n=1 Tax=Streptomyces sp. NBC_01515 TaxID=2903890 RepID=UPI00386D5C80